MANRDRILDVARGSLATGPLASLNSIAKAAGVGAGTLYRHFRSRESLVLGVYRNEIDMLVARAPMLLTKHPPIKAFRTWCDRFAQSLRMKTESRTSFMRRSRIRTFRKPIRPCWGWSANSCAPAEGSGEIRPGTDPEDFPVFIGLLWRIPPTTAGEARVKKLLALAFRGLGPNHE